MLFKKKKFERKVILPKSTFDGILSYCQIKHPEKGVLILKGKSKNGAMTITDLVIPPFGNTGTIFAGLPNSFLPFDTGYLGIVRSHPDGSKQPLVAELHDFFGLVLITVTSPYCDDSISAWDSNGDPIPLSVV